MQQFISPEQFEAFFTIEGTLWENIWILIKLAMVIFIPVESYKYFKDWFWLGTYSWQQQWRCRQAMSNRQACLQWMSMCLNDDDYSTNTRKLMLELARKWNRLTTVSNEDYDALWETTLIHCNTHDSFKAAINSYKHPEGKNLYQRYGYPI